MIREIGEEGTVLRTKGTGLVGGVEVATFTVAELESMIVVNMGDYKTARGRGN